MKIKGQKQPTKSHRLKSSAEWIIPVLISALAMYAGGLVGVHRQTVGCVQGNWLLILPWILAVLAVGLAIYKLTLTIKNKKLWPIMAAVLLIALTILFGLYTLLIANHCTVGG